MWWFWSFVALLSLGIVVAGTLLFLEGGAFRLPARCGVVGLSVLPFLVYLCARWMLSDAVFLDAERSVLLHLSGVAVAGLVALVLDAPGRRVLFWSLFASLVAMSLYGLLNHLLADSRHVLWAPRYEQYAGRATGPYFCPDHFAGAMELLFCLGGACVLDRSSRRWLRALSLLAVVLALWGVVLSKSRGSGMTLLVVGGIIVVWGFHQWPRHVRKYWRMISLALGGLLIGATLLFAQGYVERFITYGGLDRVVTASERDSEKSVVEEILWRLARTSRGRMYGGAWRAWKTKPVWGIGPGMHQHRWLEFAASADGNRTLGQWPTLVNDDFHSYEVHSDWLQLLQEYGLVGLVLFLIPLGMVTGTLIQALQRTARSWSQKEMVFLEHPPRGFASVFCGFLAIGAMGFHSLGDFNLQMPGTVWMLALLVGIALREATDHVDP